MLAVLLLVNLNACLFSACLPHASNYLPACLPACLTTLLPVNLLLFTCRLSVCFALAFFLFILLTVCFSPCHPSPVYLRYSSQSNTVRKEF
jgi:hypothetical protein